MKGWFLKWWCYQRCDCGERRKEYIILSSLSLCLHPPYHLIPQWTMCSRAPTVAQTGGNLIARRGQDSALSMVLRLHWPGCYHQIWQDKFQIDARDVSRPPTVGLKVLTSPPPTPHPIGQHKHTPLMLQPRESAAPRWRDKRRFPLKVPRWSAVLGSRFFCRVDVRCFVWIFLPL